MSPLLCAASCPAARSDLVKLARQAVTCREPPSAPRLTQEESPMPLQNRIDPWGQLNAVNARGTLMGNRGILADHEGHIVAPWRHRAWVTCRLEFKRRHRDVFSQGH